MQATPTAAHQSRFPHGQRHEPLRLRSSDAQHHPLGPWAPSNGMAANYGVYRPA